MVFGGSTNHFWLVPFHNGWLNPPSVGGDIFPSKYLLHLQEKIYDEFVEAPGWWDVTS